MTGYYELKTTSNGQFLFNLRAGNHEVILTSETYTTKAAAQAGIASVRVNAPKDSAFEKKTATDGSPYFVLKAANGEPLGRSEMYSSKAAMENGISSVKTNAGSLIVQGQ